MKASYILEVICQQILSVFVLIVFWEVLKKYDLSTLHPWHVLFSVSGIALFVGRGIQIFRKENIFFLTSPKQNRLLPHGMVMGIGFVSLSIGIILKIADIDDKSKHFASAHSILGLTTWILMFMVILGGLVACFVNTTINQKSLIKICHIIIGLVTYVIGIVTLGFGLHYLMLESDSVRLKAHNVLLVFISLYVTYSLIGPLNSLVDKIKQYVE